ncbi:MAG: hypothetical protein UT13_C0001G0705 [Candidatus Pacebacteria bacterium GW2011_GWF2_38_9]|nr:MAG: hypothetical protein US01_C0001G0737 [candidate division TM6 bacterium GW2011_GWF2_28_16]KKQ10101.1 MAG: hypothetical protein US20_C0003G0041 [Candidatus Pacebacteria bacterium GW2011_GWF1_36_5]KKQ89057.1 MAG: hypothetical protein UT13_C0001G0705 [Candidatus Pacebacteria bacterium GW2011_GWF2_38_9]MBU1034006.1 hypothetical protein [Patescibacteria group bacterium]HAZ73559.1 hypothetical protein [Candidatus Paceibacterota bacterium]
MSEMARSDEVNISEKLKPMESYKFSGSKARSLGEILRRYPKMQSNSPELYVLSYLNELGGAKI